VREYDSIRANPTHFIIVPSDEHMSSEVERVVAQTDRYWVVEKVGVAAAVSEASEPGRGRTVSTRMM
jgi:hypothetical protein